MRLLRTAICIAVSLVFSVPTSSYGKTPLDCFGFIDQSVELNSPGVSGSGLRAGDCNAPPCLADEPSGCFRMPFLTGQEFCSAIDGESPTSIFIDHCQGLIICNHSSVMDVGGDNTRHGSQFGGFTGNSNGPLENVRAFSGLATLGEASIGPAPGAPEQANWLMMIAGFGLAAGPYLLSRFALTGEAVGNRQTGA